MKRQVAIVVALLSTVALLGWLAPSNAEKTKAQKKPDGKQLFQQYCSQCHLGGGNRIKPGRPVAGSKELASLVSFKTYLSAPPGHMPYYQSLVKNDSALKALHRYCKSLKKEPVKQAMAPNEEAVLQELR